MLKNRGFSLLEILISLLISSIVFLTLFSILDQFRNLSAHLSSLLERDANAWLAPLLLSRWLPAAGNNRWKGTWEGVSFEPNLIQLNSDIQGPEGFPDSQLNNSFERLSIRCAGANLQVKSGKGSFQPILKNILSLKADSTAMPLVCLYLEAVTDRTFPIFDKSRSELTQLCFLLRNYRSSLFPEDPL